ncbi:MAG: GNAT family N-acetyltransferase [Chloroflexota bacterium]
MVQFRAADNTLISVRPMQRDDAPYLIEIFGGLGEDSRYRRFNQWLANIDDDRIWLEAERIAQSTVGTGCGLLAFADLPEIENTPVGGVRYIRTNSEEAELAVSVTDEFQGLGIGTQLVQIIIEEARKEGIKRLIGVLQVDNAPIWGLMRKLDDFYEVSRVQDGTTTYVTIHLDKPIK